MTLLDKRPARPPFEGRRAWWVALCVAIFSWDPGITRTVVPSIDDSWRFLLQQAASDGADFGVDTAFTYGPLVHLDGGPIFSLLGGLGSTIVALVLSWATALFVIRRCVSMGMHWWSTLLSAAVVTIVLIPPMRFSESVALVAAAWLTAEIVDGRASTATQHTVAMLAGIWFLVKPSAAIVMVVIVITASVAGSFVPDQPIRLTAEPLRRAAVRVSTTSGVFVAAAVGGWLLTGQKLGLIDNYLRGAQEIASGYAEAMAISPSNPKIEVAFIVLGLVLGCFLGWLALRTRDARTIFTFVLVAILLVWSRQIAFGRPGWSHLKDGGVALGLIGLAVWPLLGQRLGRGLVIVSTILTAVVLGSAPFYQVGTFASVGPVEAVDAIGELLDIDETVEANRAFLAESLAPDDHVLARMQGRRVFFSPYLGINAFAQDMEFWFPPAVQSYASFTEHLEELGAEALLAPDGPQVILHRANRAIDGRQPAWESPLLVVSMYCSFDPVDSDPIYSLLERVPETCTTEMLGETVPVTDRSVAVPASARSCAGLVTFRTFGADAGRLEQLSQLVRRPASLFITIGNEDWRVIPGTLSQPHVIAAPAAESWIGDAVPTVGLAPTEINFSESFDDRGPLTVTFECWTTQPSPEAS